MLYDFLRFGGVTIANNARTHDYLQAMGCPEWILYDKACPALRELPGEPEDASIASAPWYDLANPDVSGRFGGVYVTDVRGASDTNRSTEVTEGIDDGAAIGRTRRTARTVRVQAMLLAHGSDALDYGLAWLSASLDGGRCGQHGASCGVTDLEYLTACPPERGEVDEFTDWSESRRNMALDPASVGSTSPGWIASGQGAATISRVDGEPFGTEHATRITQGDSAGALRIGIRAPGLVAGVAYRVRLQARASWAASNWQVQYRNVITSAAGQTTFATGVPLDATVRELDFAATVVTDGSDDGAVALVQGTAPAGAWVEVTQVTIERADTFDPALPFFTGATTAPDQLERFSWTGEANASASVMESRQVTQRPENDQEYQVHLDPLRRFIHGVATTSGPLERAVANRGDWWRMDVEFTFTAERPWVYSSTRPVDLPITPTVVIQDIPYNLAPYPSAELAGGEPQTVARNYSTNPSVETNAVGWTATVANLDGYNPASFFTSGRNTDIAYESAASMRARLLGQSSGTNVDGLARIRIAQVVDLAALDPGTPVSMTIWGRVGTALGEVTDLHEMAAVGEWLNAADGIVGTVSMGSFTESAAMLAGRVFTLVSEPMPATAQKLRVAVEFEALWNSGPTGAPTDLRVYADALAVTVP